MKGLKSLKMLGNTPKVFGQVFFAKYFLILKNISIITKPNFWKFTQ